MDRLLVGIAGIIVMGIAAQWVAWRVRVPSIFLLLLAGFLAGPVTGWIDPDALLGDALFAVVGVAVAIILFEGGLSLDIAELGRIGPALRGLLVVGTPVTWSVVTIAARFILGLDWAMSTLLGAILVVTGPTVIIPLLRQVRPSRRVSAVARWEGIISDPIGAILAVLVFDLIIVGGLDGGWEPAFVGVTKALVAGGGLGLLGAAAMVWLLHKFLVPDFLRSHVTLAVVLTVFVAANSIVSEAGLLAVTVMGSAMASQSLVQVRRIVQFKENLRVLLISGLFVVLAARLPLNTPTYTDPRSVAFVAVLLCAQRPLAVWLGTLGSGLSWRERVFLALLAPRGIVAAAVGSVFAIELGHLGYAGGEQLAEIVFLVIMSTVAFYGLLAGPLARKLGLAVTNPQGLMFVGAAPWVRAFAKAIQDRGVKVLMVDSNWQRLAEARSLGLPTHYANILDEEVEDELELDGIGRCLLVTPNDEVNVLAADHLRNTFDDSQIYQIAPSSKAGFGNLSEVPHHMHSRVLASHADSWSTLSQAFDRGYVVKQTKLTPEFSFEDFERHYDNRAIPLFTFMDGMLHVLAAGQKRKAWRGGVVLSLAPDKPNAR